MGSQTSKTGGFQDNPKESETTQNNNPFTNYTNSNSPDSKKKNPTIASTENKPSPETNQHNPADCKKF